MGCVQRPRLVRALTLCGNGIPATDLALDFSLLMANLQRFNRITTTQIPLRRLHRAIANVGGSF